MHSAVRSCACVLTVLALLLLTRSVDRADADAILLSENRFVSADVFINPNTQTDTGTPPAPFAPFDDLATAFLSTLTAEVSATASQTSTVTPTLFTASGAISLEGEFDPATSHGSGNATSLFFVQFQLLTPHEFVLTGDGAGAIGGGFITFPHVQLVQGATVLAENSAAGPYAIAGLLGPGTYGLGIVAGGSVLLPNTFFESFTLEFALTEHVPEPGTVLLLLAGAAGLTAIRRVRR